MIADIIEKAGEIWIEMIPLTALGAFVGINCYAECFGFREVTAWGNLSIAVMLALYAFHFAGKIRPSNSPLIFRNLATVFWFTYSVFVWKGFVCIARLNQVDQGHWFFQVAWMIAIVSGLFGLIFCIDTFRRAYGYFRLQHPKQSAGSV